MRRFDKKCTADQGGLPRRPPFGRGGAVGLLLLVALPASLVGCATMATMEERYVACQYDTVWDTALETLKDAPIDTRDKEGGVIETDWIETPVLGRPYGVFQREGLGDKERVRTLLTLSQRTDMTIVRLSERREHFGFRGGARIYQWYQVEPSEQAVAALMQRLTARLEEQGCFVGT